MSVLVAPELTVSPVPALTVDDLIARLGTIPTAPEDWISCLEAATMYSDDRYQVLDTDVTGTHHHV